MRGSFDVNGSEKAVCDKQKEETQGDILTNSLALSTIPILCPRNKEEGDARKQLDCNTHLQLIFVLYKTRERAHLTFLVEIHTTSHQPVLPMSFASGK